MVLLTAQLQAIKTHINASADMNTRPNDETDQGNVAIVALLNAQATPNTFWVWKTNVSRAEIYNTQSDTGTDWAWATYKAQSVGEQGAWTQMFMGDRADFSKPNLRAGVANIFGASNNNNLHCLAIGRRLATRLEKVLSVGTGTTASPAVMGAEGAITLMQVGEARNL